MPCSTQRARELLSCGKAAVFKSPPGSFNSLDQWNSKHSNLLISLNGWIHQMILFFIVLKDITMK